MNEIEKLKEYLNDVIIIIKPKHPGDVFIFSDENGEAQFKYDGSEKILYCPSYKRWMNIMEMFPNEDWGTVTDIILDLLFNQLELPVAIPKEEDVNRPRK